MSLKSRLQRLGTPSGLASGRVRADERASPKDRVLDRPFGTGARARASEGAQQGLGKAAEALRGALGGAARTPPVAASSESGAFPFEPLETPFGRVARRRVRFGPDELPRAASPDSIERADPRVLSLLALDPKLAQVNIPRALFFDTETTGLGGAGSLAFLVGLGWFESGAFVLEQLLLEGPEQEPALLSRVRELFARAELLVSFNGKSFDLPLLTGRCVMNQLERLETPAHLDLLHVARRVHKRRLDRFRLSRLEAHVLGVLRPKEDIPGDEIPPRFGHYLRTGDFSQVEPVVLHNEWDVLSMVGLVGTYGQPLSHLEGSDLLGVAETYRRSRHLGGALEVVAGVMTSEPSSLDALALRARLHKAQGDRARALLDFEQLADRKIDPEVRLELAKLYEHYKRDFERALAILQQGTGEDAEALHKRKSRLEAKLERQRRALSEPVGRGLPRKPDR